MSITFDAARQDVIRYLTTKDDKYFEERGTTRNAVFCDYEQLDLIASEHLKCVNSYGCDIEWSLKDACDVEPGIRPSEVKDRILVKAKTVEDAVRKIKEEYFLADICIGELFAMVEVEGLSVEDVTKVYAELYEDIEGDEICRVDEDGMRYSIGT